MSNILIPSRRTVVDGSVVLFQHVWVSAAFFEYLNSIDRFKCCLCTDFCWLVRVIAAEVVISRVGGLVWFVVLDAYLCILKSEQNHWGAKFAWKHSWYLFYLMSLINLTLTVLFWTLIYSHCDKTTVLTPTLDAICAWGSFWIYLKGQISCGAPFLCDMVPVCAEILKLLNLVIGF